MDTFLRCDEWFMSIGIDVRLWGFGAIGIELVVLQGFMLVYDFLVDVKSLRKKDLENLP